MPVLKSTTNVCLRFEILMAAKVLIVFFSLGGEGVVTPCGLVSGYQLYGVAGSQLRRPQSTTVCNLSERTRLNGSYSIACIWYYIYIHLLYSL
jgi:hypothetical protein